MYQGPYVGAFRTSLSACLVRGGVGVGVSGGDGLEVSFDYVSYGS